MASAKLLVFVSCLVISSATANAWKGQVVVPQTVTVNRANGNTQSNSAAGAVGGTTNTGNTKGFIAASALNGNAVNLASPVDNAGTNGIASGGKVVGETNQVAALQAGRHLLTWNPRVVVVPQTATVNNANKNTQSNAAAGAVGGNTDTNGIIAASALNGNAANIASPVDNAGTNGISAGGSTAGETNQLAFGQVGRRLLTNGNKGPLVVPQTVTVNRANGNTQSNSAAGAVGGNTDTKGLVAVSALNGNAANIASPVDNAGTNGISAGGSTAGETNQLAFGQVGRRLLNWKPVVFVPQTVTANNANGNAQSNTAAGAVGGTTTTDGALAISAGNGNAANIASPVDNAGTNGIAAGGNVFGMTNQGALGQFGRHLLEAEA